MKILHLSDLHFGALSHSRTDPATGIQSALLSVNRCWEAAMDIAEDEHPDLVILAGDQFQSKNPDALSLNFFRAGLRRLEGVGVPVVMIDGNHDGRAQPHHPSIAEMFDDRPRVYAAATPEIVEAGGLRVACLPWVSRAPLMASRAGISRAEAETAVFDHLSRILAGFRAEQVDVLTGHWSVQGAVLDNERDISMLSEPVIPLADLEGFPLVAFGHIHRAQMLGAPAFGNYSGSIDRMNFGEEREEKGCYEIRLGNPTETIWHPLPARRFVTIDPWEEGLNNADVDEAIVRVLDVPPANADVVRAKVLAMGAQIVYVHPLIEREVVRRAESVTETLTPTDALDQWMTLREIDEDRRPGIRETAKALITEPAP
jgi:exonuclease SbcD